MIYLFEIEYYTEKDQYPVFEFINKQTPKDQAKILREIDMLCQFGFSLGLPHIKKKEVINMNHEDAKKLLLKDPEVKKEYDALEPIYEIRKQLIELRLQQGLSQKELAEKIGTKQSAISRLENGSYNPSVEFLGKIAHALGKEIQVKFF